MSKQYPKPTNIKIKFAGDVVALANVSDRQTTRAGVVLWIQQQPAGNVRPMATIPDGTLEQYKHCRPKIISCNWE